MLDNMSGRDTTGRYSSVNHRTSPAFPTASNPNYAQPNEISTKVVTTTGSYHPSPYGATGSLTGASHHKVSSNTYATGSMMSSPSGFQTPKANIQPSSSITQQRYTPTVGVTNSFTKEATTTETLSTTTFANPEDFENMVGDLRRTFIGWLKKTETELRREKETVTQERQTLEEERERAWKQLQHDKQLELDKIKDERRKCDLEVQSAMKQLTIERDDTRRRINDDRAKFETERDLHRKKMILDKEKFRQEYEMFEVERKRIVDNNIATETMIDINVGGVVFETSRHTLLQQPGSLLEGLLSGRHHVSRDRNGRVFIDRDSELFRTILNFLRSPATPPIPRDQAESEAICKEAEYYNIRFFPFPLVFACGGHSGTEHLRAMEVLDVGQQCWRPCRPMSTDRAYFGSAVLHNRLYCFGGQNLDYKALCETEVYDCLRDTWMIGGSLNIPRRNTCGASVAERIFSIGGFDGGNILSSVEAFDPRLKNWMEIAPLTTPRSSAMAAVAGGRIYVMGGTKGDRLRTVEVYEPRMDKWEVFGSDMIEVRSAGAACSSVDHIYALGGTDASHEVHSSVEVLDPESQRWSFVASMPTPRMDAACVVVSESVMVGGGQHGEVLNSTQFYRPELDEWQPGPPMLFPRYGHCFLLTNL